MLTFFTIPRPFDGAAKVAQLNALRSWRALGPDVEILVFGGEHGAAEAAAEVGARDVPEIGRTEWGTPLVSDAFAAAPRLATHESLCYANADIVMTPDLPQALARLAGRRALVIGRRTDVDLGRELSFDRGWETALRDEAARVGQLGTERQIDYLAFPRDTDWKMPEFAVGRPLWDNWVLHRARQLGLDIVDATEAILVVHQSHGYEHVPERRGHRWFGPEADRHARHMEGHGRPYGFFDATHVLTRDRLLPALSLRHLKRRARRSRVLGPGVRALDTLLKR